MWIWSASYPAPRAVIISLPSLTAPADCAPALFQGWIAHFGVPEAIISDCGLQFTSSIWAALCQLLNIQHMQTTAYHPEGNGMVERFHGSLKDALCTHCPAPDWMDHLR